MCELMDRITSELSRLSRDLQSIEADLNNVRVGLKNLMDFIEEPSKGLPSEFKEYKLLFKKVRDLELSVRTANSLQNENIDYIGDLIQLFEPDMLRLPNFGRKSLNETKEALSMMGFGFGMKLPLWIIEKLEEHQSTQTTGE